ncbi:MAG: urea carboxylase, partial [Burkholderiales bacterium]
MTEVLANPLAARDHARRMAGTVVEAMQVLPPVADDLPAGLSADDLLWEET